MHGRILKRDRTIVVRPPFRNVSRLHQGSAHEAMPDHARGFRRLFLGESQELPRELAQSIAVERHIICGPEAVEDGEQQ